MHYYSTILGKGNTNNSVELACGLGGGNQFFGNLKRNYESNVVNRELRDRILADLRTVIIHLIENIYLNKKIILKI